MNDNYIIKYIKTKNKFRKIITYKENSPMIDKHRNISMFINNKTIPSKFSKGYVRNQSVYTNALSHMYNDIFLKYDIKNFFNSMNHFKLVELLHKELKKTLPNVLKTECAFIVNECSVDKKGLPLGLITSPILSNIYLKEFDNILYGKLKQMNLKNVIYTRYADDMVISYKFEDNGKNVHEIANEVKEIIKILLNRYHLKLNLKKEQIVNLNKCNHVRITGVSISTHNGTRKLSVGRNQKRKLYFRAIKCYETKDSIEIKKIKGLQSFYLSIEKNVEKYESFMSPGMRKYIKEQYGKKSIKNLIDDL